MLNDAQLRHVSAVIQTNERRLTELQQQLNGSPGQKLLDLMDDLNDAEHALVTRKTAELVRLVAQLSEQFALAPEWRSLRRTLVGYLSVVWADLQDAKAAALRAYGATDPRLPETLDPLIDRIASGLLGICHAIGEGDTQTTGEE